MLKKRREKQSRGEVGTGAIKRQEQPMAPLAGLAFGGVVPFELFGMEIT